MGVGPGPPRLSLCLPPAFPPMPVPPAGFAGLTPEELRALEGHERQHLEARLQSLRNIHTLLDAAMLQINQYLTVLASLGYVCTGAGVRGGSLELPARPAALVPGLSLRPPCDACWFASPVCRRSRISGFLDASVLSLQGACLGLRRAGVYY